MTLRKFWTFANNLDFGPKYDLATIVARSRDRASATEALRNVPTLRPTEDDHYLHYKFRWAWDHLLPDKIAATMQRTYNHLELGGAAPREEWLIVGLAASPDDEWCPPHDYYDLIDEVTISVDGSPDFKDELFTWVTQRSRLAKIKRLLRWIPWG
jgi:hypothetical protein